MLGDTITLTVGGVSKVLDRVSIGDRKSSFVLRELGFIENVDYKLLVRHTDVKATSSRPAADRHNVELTKTTRVNATGVTSISRTYIVFETPIGAGDNDLSSALYSWLIASSNLVLGKLNSQQI